MEEEIPRFWAWIATHSLTRSFYGGARPQKKNLLKQCHSRFLTN
jgi:hypothetical protein